MKSVAFFSKVASISAHCKLQCKLHHNCDMAS